MKLIFTRVIIFIMIIYTPAITFSQTFTMGKKCRELLNTANEALHNKSYNDALSQFTAFSDDCKTKDAKVLSAVGRAEAYNGLGQYDQAISEADAALKITKDRNLSAHFQKGVAYSKLGNTEASKSELAKVIELTENNQNTSERAANYALMAAIYDRQLGDRDSALIFLDQAMALDPDNTEFWIQKGEMYVMSGQYDEAFSAFDKAVAMGKADLDMYSIRSNTALRMVSDKYGTTKAKELKEKMTPDEKNLVCTELNKAIELGLEDMNKDMFAALVCK
ncbi:tetratricopeptide repeat protein [Marinigracilibium pacificum]|uniref:Tetratricopeptide repeat protein n=1 Tax=Marinigracilibium pacificum TaxID=2729599 RepID=A0A848IWB2_9BACT|nr:tetratricopeptide repeat protein [Marinigracilibium pacificum]NMM47541.1 hypothetical protein [Marinigracilibium pacificum]